MVPFGLMDIPKMWGLRSLFVEEKSMTRRKEKWGKGFHRKGQKEEIRG